MSFAYDFIGWIGSFLFEFARYEVLQAHMQAYGFEFIKVSGQPASAARNSSSGALMTLTQSKCAA